ncbi:MAG: hypothetical protein RLO52_47260 [Sandaracinaceae bacterium]
MEVSAPELDVDALPVTSLFIDYPGAEDPVWRSETCRGGDMFEYVDGAVRINDTYCTREGMTVRFTMAPAEGRQRFSLDGPIVFESSLFAPDALPLVHMYCSKDGGSTWRIQYKYCAGGNTFEISEGRMSIPDTGCNQACTHVEVVWRDPDERFEGLTSEMDLAFGSYDPLAMPLFQILFSNDGGATWKPRSLNTVNGLPLREVDGQLVITGGWWAAGPGRRYQLIVDQE